jgi:hypothetical protein
MKIDLFSTTLFEHLSDDFGIHDDARLPTEPAKIVPFEDGIAKAKNQNGYSIYFVPLDKNIECLRADGSKESQCDALLICLRPKDKFDFYFVELKEANSSWLLKGIEQLKTTISTFKNSYDLSCLNRKRAYLANGNKPDFKFSYKENMERFRCDTGFRLDIGVTIPIK